MRMKFEEAWGVPLPTTPGYRLDQMMSGLHDGRIRALYLVGENPAQTEPNARHVEEGLAGLEFLVSQDLFLNESSRRFAHVVLPASSFAEKEGTFTNTERRVNLVRAAVPLPGSARIDREIVIDLARHLGASWPKYADAESVWNELADLSPNWFGIRYDRLEDQGIQWPCPTLDHPGTQFLYAPSPARPNGKGKFFPVEFQPPIEQPDSEYPLVLSTGRTLYHYNSATMTMRESGHHRQAGGAVLRDLRRGRRRAPDRGRRDRRGSSRGAARSRRGRRSRTASIPASSGWRSTSPRQGQLAHARRRRPADRHARVQGVGRAGRARGVIGEPRLHVPECESTQALLLGSGLPEGAVATTDHQTAGRGRLGRTWEDAPGTAVLVSVLLRPPAGRRAPELSLVAGLATAETVETQPVFPRRSSGRTTSCWAGARSPGSWPRCAASTSSSASG